MFTVALFLDTQWIESTYVFHKSYLAENKEILTMRNTRN